MSGHGNDPRSTLCAIFSSDDYSIAAATLHYAESARLAVGIAVWHSFSTFLHYQPGSRRMMQTPEEPCVLLMAV